MPSKQIEMLRCSLIQIGLLETKILCFHSYVDLEIVTCFAYSIQEFVEHVMESSINDLNVNSIPSFCSIDSARVMIKNEKKML